MGEVAMEKTYNFTIIASGLDLTLGDEAMDCLFEAGCSDATIAVQDGLVVLLEFDRSSRTFVSALASAITDVMSAHLYSRWPSSSSTS